MELSKRQAGTWWGIDENQPFAPAPPAQDPATRIDAVGLGLRGPIGPVPAAEICERRHTQVAGHATVGLTLAQLRPIPHPNQLQPEKHRRVLVLLQKGPGPPHGQQVSDGCGEEIKRE